MDLRVSYKNLRKSTNKKWDFRCSKKLKVLHINYECDLNDLWITLFSRSWIFVLFDQKVKVQLFWESLKNLSNLPNGFDIFVKTIRQIAKNFVAFSEKLNFIRNSTRILSNLKGQAKSKGFFQANDSSKKWTNEF